MKKTKEKANEKGKKRKGRKSLVGNQIGNQSTVNGGGRVGTIEKIR